MLFKYSDHTGRQFISCRNRSAAVLDRNVRYFNDLKSLLLQQPQPQQQQPHDSASSVSGSSVLPIASLPPALQALQLPTVQSITCEMCGFLYPQLVRYPFPLAVVPLFVTLTDGRTQLATTSDPSSGFSIMGSVPDDAVLASRTLVADPARRHLEITNTRSDSRLHLFPFTRSTEIDQICSYLQRVDEIANVEHVSRLYNTTTATTTRPLATPPQSAAATTTTTACDTSTSDATAPSTAPPAADYTGSPAAPDRCRYWFNHICTEGWVMYLLQPDGRTLVHREAMLKVKPASARERHWSEFDQAFQAQVLEAVYKLYDKHASQLSSAALRQELDLIAIPYRLHGESANELQLRQAVWDNYWERFEQQIMTFAAAIPNHRTVKPANAPRVLVLCGLPGSGKSTFCNALTLRQPTGWSRVNQDEVCLQAPSRCNCSC
jgi:hypothetical protein